MATPLFTDDEDGEKPTVTGVWDSEEEARSIGEEIEQLQIRLNNIEIDKLDKIMAMLQEMKDKKP